MNKQERIVAAKERLMSRYPDSDEVEVEMMLKFKGLTKEELKDMYLKASSERDKLVEEERLKRESDEN